MWHIQFKRSSPFALLALLWVISGYTQAAQEAQPKSPWKFDGGFYAIYDSHQFEGSVFDEEEITEETHDYLRRAKAAFAVSYNKKFSVELEVEYKEQEDEFQVDDFNFNYQINPNIEFTLGKFKEPIGLENQLSLRYQPLLERSITSNTLLFGRHKGIAFDIEHDHWTLDLAITYHKGKTRQYRDALAHIARYTYAPITKKKKFLHFGINLSSRTNTVVDYDIDEPLIATGLGNLIHSPTFNATGIKLQGLEFAARYKPVLFQTEYFEQRIEQSGLADQTLFGQYATLVYTLFGNKRSYEHGKLKFRGKKSHTLEVATRYSHAHSYPAKA